MPFTATKPEEIEAHLANNPYLTEGGLPGADDARVYFELNGVAPAQDKTPNFHFWFFFVRSWSDDLLQSWIAKATPATTTEAPKKSDEDDLFGDDDAPAKPAPKVVPPKKKEKPAAKSIVVFEVKVY